MGDPLQRLFALEHIGIKLGLDSIRTVCDALGHPEHAYPTLIVAGTNGKGSVTAMADTALRAAGLRSARYTSPHLERVEERFVIDGREVAPERLAATLRHVFDVVDRLLASQRLLVTPTFFEVVTATAFELFRQAAVDVAVLEVGMGGRFDATNVANPLAGAIVSIDLEHQQYLGSTIAQIAFEKAGICRPGMTVVCGERKTDAVHTIARVAHEVGATLVPAHEGTETAVEEREGRAYLSLATPAHRYGVIPLGLRGRHQVDNAIVTVRLLEAAAAAGLAIPFTAITRGLVDVRWPARLEVIERPGGRHAILDAAHNPAGAAALASYLHRWHPAGVPIVFGVVQDKDVEAMVRVLAPCATRLIATQAPVLRALPARALAGRLRQLAPGVPVDEAPDPVEAVACAAAAGDPVVIAGSIFLAGAVRGHLI